jgi:hypothetical protein
MKKISIAAAVLALLAACGVESDPVPPQPKPPSGSSVTVTGDARVGVTYNG